jgi:hypothetical protein
MSFQKIFDNEVLARYGTTASVLFVLLGGVSAKTAGKIYVVDQRGANGFDFGFSAADRFATA